MTAWRSAARAACPAISQSTTSSRSTSRADPRLVNGLFEWGYIEQLGLGIDRMIEEMVQARPPRTGVQADAVFLHGDPRTRQRLLWLPWPRAVPEWAKGLNERQLLALQYLQQYARIADREFHELCRMSPPRRSASTWPIWWRRGWR